MSGSKNLESASPGNDIASHRHLSEPAGHRRNRRRRRTEGEGCTLHLNVEWDPVEKALRRRVLRPFIKPCDILVTDLTDFPTQLNRAVEALSAHVPELNVFGIGLGISRAINLSLQVADLFKTQYTVMFRAK
ncbi:unnamed protein product [Notodromas monacha]|uniref:Uncharacterized protein n=1 Tax=Notodromas monacha TaxID=399045 RepID=A0A7R9GG38_9CRUS|nr:unnamed protein product [Notodromas monacha]CAG0921437.1 unnamed protein product [Notodromas monacha]